MNSKPNDILVWYFCPKCRMSSPINPITDTWCHYCGQPIDFHARARRLIDWSLE